jgi:mono/diheme cytochrome c family protein
MTAVAEAAYNPAAFDTISWETNQEAIERGSVVYRFSCTKCHGDRGYGDANFVRHGDTLVPPSFRDEDWIYAQDKDGLRQAVFVGTAEDMPHWGLEGLPPRDIDAVAIYIIQSMRGN